MSDFLTDLIWIGNTLYPRWFVIVAVVGACIPVAVLLAWIDYQVNRTRS